MIRSLICGTFVLFLVLVIAGPAWSVPPGGGPPGLEGIAGDDGLSCWDLNGDGVCNSAEDIDGGGCSASDCIGPAGPEGPEGPIGLTGDTGADGARTYTGIPPINVDNTDDEIGLNAASMDGDLLMWDATGNNWIAAPPAFVMAGTDRRQPFLALNYIIALTGLFPSTSGGDPFIAEIILFAGNFAPQGWAFCNGQLLAINQNQSLFALLGTNFGGDGRSTLGLPDLRGRVPVHDGNSTGPGLSNYNLGQKGGSETH